MLQRCIFGMQEQVRLQISALIFPSTYISQLPGGSSGDGLAFFLSPNGSQVPEHAGGGYLGLITNSSNLNQSENPIVAVEFDTFKNVGGLVRVGGIISTLVFGWRKRSRKADK
ncbi:hypothetical protein QYF36_010943 [Acer negundo]|nr:hypothetical protein QYF36_010943 [Acer negundo]